jgi:hypothetical protein
MQEIEELSHGLAHQAEACYLTSPNNTRPHAFSMIAGLASLEARLLERKYNDLAKTAERAISKCTACIRSTALTSKCYACSREDLKKLEASAKKLEPAKWEELGKKRD